MNTEAELTAMLRAGADAPCGPEQRAGIIALAVMIFWHPQAGDMPENPAARYALVGQLASNPRAWVVASRPDHVCAFIRPPIYAAKDARPIFGMKSIDFRQWDTIKDVIDAGLRVDGHEVPAAVKPAIRDAYEVWRKAQWGPRDDG
ncbi:hypothetical protein ACW7G2_03260 [Luteimonas sp. A277]